MSKYGKENEMENSRGKFIDFVAAISILELLEWVLRLLEQAQRRSQKRSEGWSTSAMKKG